MFGFLDRLGALFSKPAAEPPPSPSSPGLPVGLALTTVQRTLMTDKGCNGAKVLRDCNVVLLVVRDRVIARYNDRMILLIGDDQYAWWGNCDPGATGINKAIGKPYARLQSGVWAEIRGRHKLRPNRFRQPSLEQALTAGLPMYFTDARAKGHVTVDRMLDAARVAYTETGYFAINLHDGAETKTGSAGCMTLPPKSYIEFRDLAYAGMNASRQSFLPVVLVDGKL